MEYKVFVDILETMRAREDAEAQLFEFGVDTFGVTSDLYNCILRLFDEIYPESKGAIADFCYGDGDQIKDEFGRVFNLNSIYDLYLYLEHHEFGAWVYAEPYGEGQRSCAHGHYLGIDFWINWNGIAPCAYIDANGIEGARSILDGIVHGGVTYFDSCLPFDDQTEFAENGIIGWDYGHGGDADANRCDGRVWTTHDIMIDIRRAIDKLKEYKEI